MHLSRTGKIVRNLLLALLLWGLTWTALGFPCTTVAAMCRQHGQTLMMELEPVHTVTYRLGFPNEPPRRLILARSGDTYVSFTYQRLRVPFLWNRLYADASRLSEGPMALARDGTLYILGDFTAAAEADAVVTPQETTVFYTADLELRKIRRGETRPYAFSCEKVNDHLFTARYRPEGDSAFFPVDYVPQEKRNLEQFVNGTYKSLNDGTDGRCWLHQPVPVQVTLYNWEGAVLDTLDLSVDTYEFDPFS